MKIERPKARAALAFAVALLTAGAAAAAPLNLQKAPLFLNSSVDPNIAVTVDDSGSMASAFMPDSVDDGCGWRHPRYYASNWNRIYYNPAIKYTPPLKPDGTPFPDATFTAAWRDGYEAQTGFVSGALGSSTLDLSKNYRATRSRNARSSSGTTGTEISHVATFDASSCQSTWTFPFATGSGASLVSPAFYYKLTGADPTSAASYTAVQVGDAEKQNFANWYSYYRTRYLMARTALSRVFGVQDDNLRIVWQNLNSNKLASASKVTKFTSTGRTDFFNWLYRTPSDNATPLRASMIRVGEFFARSSGTDLTNPYWEPPQAPATTGKELVCRQNFHVMMTDGYTNETTNPSLGASPRDHLATTLPDGTAYSTSDAHSKIFWDEIAASGTCGTSGGTCSPTLGDIAFHYWAKDLRGDLANKVPSFVPDRSVTAPASDDATEIYFNPNNDPATWQHLVQYIVGLGVAGTMAYPGDYNALRTDSAKKWPALKNDSPSAVDDAWHAAINSRGEYFSAQNPSELVDSLSAVLKSVLVRRGSASAATVTSGIIQSSTLAFRTAFDSGDWSGKVTAYTVDETGQLQIGSPKWEAGEKLTARGADDRVIYTSTDADGGGVAFRWGNLPAAYQASLDDDPSTVAVDDDGLGEARLNYLRGDRTNELDKGGKFRIRASTLGAVVNSGAVVVSAPSAAYDDQWPSGAYELDKDAETYAAFRATHKSRNRVIYVGANDGMLHAFDAGTGASASPSFGSGDELWAYVPREVVPRLSTLTNPVFAFEPFVDLTPTVRDVYDRNTKQWRTLLVGGLRRGGQGVFALDVTTAKGLDEADASSVVLWEYADDIGTAEAKRMGYTYGRPIISRLNVKDGGRWVVVVNGGYNSDEADGNVGDGTGSLFVLDAITGDLLREINVPEAKGLSAVTMGDYDSDFTDEFAVAGDLNGNLWRFDLSNPEPANWSVVKVFAPASTGKQPITAAPRIFPDPATGNVIIVFGTGKYLEPSDRTTTGTPTQSFYGVRDYGAASTRYPVTRSALQAQTLTAVAQPDGSKLLKVSNNGVTLAQDGWYVDLLDVGERSVTSFGAQFSLGFFIASTIIPNGDDPCEPSLRGNVFLLNAATGGQSSFAVMDTTKDGYISSGDDKSVIGRSVAQSVPEGSPSVLVPPGGGIGRLVDFPEIKIPQTVWRRRGWHELRPESD